MAKYEALDVEDGDDRRDSDSPLLAAEEFIWATSRRTGRFPSLEAQRSGLLALVFVLVLALAGQSVVHHTPPRPPPSRSPVPPPPPPPPALAATPQLEVLRLPSGKYDELNRGRWEAPARVWTKETVVEVWGSPAVNSGRLRLEAISALSWTPEGEIRDWDTFDFFKRMYNSQKGLLLVGGECLVFNFCNGHLSTDPSVRSAFADSVTLQSVEALKSLLNLPSPSNNYRGKSTSWYQKATGSPLHQALFASNATRELLRRALPNVPAPRFDQPFAHILRHDTLLHPEELRSIAVAEGLGETIKFEGWLQNSTWEAVLPSRKEEEWEGEENSVLFFNTGAHWSLVCLGLDASGLAKLGRAAVSSFPSSRVRLANLLAHRLAPFSLVLTPSPPSTSFTAPPPPRIPTAKARPRRSTPPSPSSTSTSTPTGPGDHSETSTTSGLRSWTRRRRRERVKRARACRS